MSYGDIMRINFIVGNTYRLAPKNQWLRSGNNVCKYGWTAYVKP